MQMIFCMTGKTIMTTILYHTITHQNGMPPGPVSSVISAERD
jgi:hypothetical protein